MREDLTNQRVADGVKNRIAILGVSIINICLIVSYFIEILKNTRSIGSYLVIFVLCALTPLLSIILHKKKKEDNSIRYILSGGFCLLYSYLMATASTDLVFSYIIVLFILMTVYMDRKLSVGIGIYAVLLNIVLVIWKAFTTGLSSTQITNAEIIIACLLLSIIFMSLSTSKVQQINTANIEKAKQEILQSEELLEKITHITDKIAGSILVANDESKKLNETISGTKNSMEELDDEITEAVCAIEEQQKNTEEIGNYVKQVEEETEVVITNVKSTDNSLRIGQTMMENLLEQVCKVDMLNNDVIEEMEELRKYANNMQQIVVLIDEIASQTSLLSLNASIEAARAGDAGKGFAIVASEISNLATQTATSTENIGKLIQNITDSLGNVDQSIENLLESNKAQGKLVTKTAERFKEINHNTTSIKESILLLKDSVDYMTKANKIVAENTQNISVMTQKVALGTTETLKTCEDNKESIATMTNILMALQESTEELKQN